MLFLAASRRGREAICFVVECVRPTDPHPGVRASGSTTATAAAAAAASSTSRFSGMKLIISLGCNFSKGSNKGSPLSGKTGFNTEITSW